MECPKCGLEIDDKTIVCPNCKKVYSVLQQAQLAIISEYGTFDNLVTSNTYNGQQDDSGNNILDYTNTNYIKNLFAKQLKVVQNCESGNDCLGKPVYFLNGNREGIYKDPALVLADGIKIFFGWTYWRCTSSNVCLDLGVALPGGDKSRYTKGKDIFYFSVQKNKIVPKGKTSGALSETECSKAHARGGYDCAAWVIYNENLDYTRCDDLEWNKKTKCK